MRSTMTAVTVAAGLWLGAAVATACTPPNGCEGAVLFPVGGAMPSTAAGIEWWSPGRALTTAGVRLELRDVMTGAWREVASEATAGATAAQVTLRPTGGFAANTHYRVTTASECVRMAAGDPRELRWRSHGDVDGRDHRGADARCFGSVRGLSSPMHGHRGPMHGELEPMQTASGPMHGVPGPMHAVGPRCTLLGLDARSERATSTAA